MIFNTQIFKKMLKGAYTGSGLNVAREKGRYIFAGEYWYMTIRGDVFPKKAKAAAIELIGEFPASGENFVIRNKEERQMGEFNKRWREVIENRLYPPEDLFQKTKVSLEYGCGGLGKLWQNEMKEIVVLNDPASEIVSNGNINEDYETVPEGPYKIGEVSNGGIMFWVNNACKFYVLAPQIEDDSNKDFFDVARNIRLPGVM